METDLIKYREQMRTEISDFLKRAKTHTREREQFAYKLMANQLKAQHDKVTKIIGDGGFASKIW